MSAEKLPGESCGADSFQTNELSMDKCHMHESEDVLDSPFSSAVGQANPSFQNIPSESIPSCTTSGGAHKEVVKASRSTISSSFCDNKSAYSSVVGAYTSWLVFFVFFLSKFITCSFKRRVKNSGI